MKKKYFCNSEGRLADNILLLYKDKIIYQARAVWQLDTSGADSDYILRALFAKLAADKKPANLQIVGLWDQTPHTGQFWTDSIIGNYFNEAEFIATIKQKIQVSTEE